MYKINKAFDWYREVPPSGYRALLPKYFEAIKYDIADILMLNNTGVCDIMIFGDKRKGIEQFYGITFPDGLVIKIDGAGREFGTFRIIYKGAELLDIAFRNANTSFLNSGEIYLSVFLPRADQYRGDSIEGVVLKLKHEPRFHAPHIITPLADPATLAILFKTMALLHKKAVIHKVKTQQLKFTAEAEKAHQKHIRDMVRAKKYTAFADEYFAPPLPKAVPIEPSPIEPKSQYIPRKSFLQWAWDLLKLAYKG
jgi:hypothetical protein